MPAPVITHYEILGVSPSASHREIEAAYNGIIRENSPDVLSQLGPFSRRNAEKRVKDAYAVWSVLSNIFKRKVYDDGIHPQLGGYQGRRNGSYPNMESFDPHNKNDRGPSRDGRSEFSTHFDEGGRGEPHYPCANDSDSTNDKDGSGSSADEAPDQENAAYRYAKTETGTVVDVSISKWRLQLNLSPKFKFLNDVSELSDPADKETICFQMGVAYSIGSEEASEATINELTIKVMSLPDPVGGRGALKTKPNIARLQTVFKESLFSMPTLTVTMTSAPLLETVADASPAPWEFGFDFNLSKDIQSHRKGTCLFFSREEYPARLKMYVGVDSPEYVLSRDKEVKAEVFKNMDGERLIKLKYGDVEMWRLAAAGCKA